MEPIVSRVDHVVVPVEEPEALLGVFTERLGLPRLWPVVDLGPFRSGAVAFGNAWIEIVSGGEAISKHFAARLPAAVRGIALEPSASCEQCCAMLDERGVAHEGLLSLDGRRADGTQGPIVGVVTFSQPQDSYAVYLCELGIPLPAEAVRRKTDRAGGGALGILGIDEIQIASPDPDGAAAQWQRVFDPLPPARRNTWRAGDGPAIRVKESPIAGVTGIVVKVRSLGAARDVLERAGLLGPVRRSGLGIHYAATHGLDIWLTE